MADADRMKELLGKKKVALKPIAAPRVAPKAPASETIQRDDVDGITLERPLAAPARNGEEDKVTVEADLTPLADSTRPPAPEPAAPKAVPVSLPPAPKAPAGSGVDKLIEGVAQKLIPELQKLVKPLQQQLEELRGELGQVKQKLEELTGKVNTHEEDMNQLNEELEGKMGVGALQAAEQKVQELEGKVEAAEKKVGELAGKVETHDQDLGQLNTELEAKASGERLERLEAAVQVVAGEDYERVHGLAQDYQESTTRLLIDYLLDLNEGNVNEFVDVLNRRGGDLCQKLMTTFVEVPETVMAELARRKGYKLSELADPDSVSTSERAMGAAGAKVEVEQEAVIVLENAKSILMQISQPEQSEGES
ncbi:MAG TPA: hypothetical protein VLD37_06335 [Candidatus Bilamarchaeum sp.]|nr:hypothetical protein [Candidatus Bilamarchaeum sp.]